MKKLAIFDLDGTLLNTIADLAHSTNYALNKLGYPTHEIEKYNFMVGNGINKLFERALPEGEKTEENVLRVRKEFIPHYDIHNADDSRPYPGVPELLTDLQSAGIQIAVASNKYQAATEKLIAHYFPSIHFTAVFGQREGISVKPDPTVVFDILKLANVEKDFGTVPSKERASNSYPLSVVSTTSKPNFFANDWSESQLFCFFAPSIQMPDLPFSLASVIQYSINAFPYPFPRGLPNTHKQYR